MKDIRIVTLHRGWVVVGEFKKDAAWCELLNANVVRRWGTSKGLGELALNGPNASTVLDKCGDMDIPVGAIIKTQKCETKKWSRKL
jgi:hypothetical protein